MSDVAGMRRAASAVARDEERARQAAYRRRRRGTPSWGLLARPFEAGRAEAEARKEMVRMAKWRRRMAGLDTRLTAKDLYVVFGRMNPT